MKQLEKFILLLAIFLLCTAMAPAQLIQRLYPGNPYPGEELDIEGTGFADPQGPWKVTLYRIVSGRSQDHYCTVFSWSSTQVRVQVPPDIPPGEYVLKLVIPNQLAGSNGTRITIRERPINPLPPTMSPLISRTHVTVQYELWIYGRHFGFQAGNRGIPDGARAVFYGNEGAVDLDIKVWADEVVKAWLPPRCAPGVHQVAIVKGEQAWKQSNRMDVTVLPEMVGQAHPGNVPGFMHIDAARPIPITRGLAFTILGNHFDVYRRNDRNQPIRVGMGRRVVELVDIVDGRSRAHGCRIASSNSMTEPDYMDQGNLLWFNDHVVAAAPDDLAPGEYLLRILDHADNRSSNTLRVRVVRHANDALAIERVTVTPIMAGGVRELTIHGRNFGRTRRQGRVDFSPGSPGFLIRDWSNDQIRLELAHTVQPGRYTVRVFADATRDDGSNQLAFDIEGRMHIDRVNIRYVKEEHEHELTIQGRYFGESAGRRFIDIEPNATYRVWHWSDNEIRITTSSGIRRGQHSLRILEGQGYPGGSNTVHFIVAYPMHIDHVKTRYIREEHAHELIIQGRYFGKTAEQRFIDIKPDASYRVWQWSDESIRITLSSGIRPGRYSLRILERGGSPEGSNTAYFTLSGKRP